MAIPFRYEPEPPVAHYLRVQNLLRELMTLISRMPWVIAGDEVSYLQDNSVNMFSTRRPQDSGEVRDRHWVQEQQNSVSLIRRSHERQQHREQEQREQEQREQRQSLPDLVTSCAQPANPPPPPPPPPPPQQQQLPAQQQPAAGADDVDDKIAGAVKLQIAVCPTCYYGKDRKLKVIAVAKLDNNGKPIRWTSSHDDEEPVVVENNSSKVKQRIMSLLQPSKIESSVLTAMFVIIGWKMFIKH